MRSSNLPQRTVAGYSLLEADSYDEIAALLEGHPRTAMGGTIDV